MLISCLYQLRAGQHFWIYITSFRHILTKFCQYVSKSTSNFLCKYELNRAIQSRVMIFQSWIWTENRIGSTCAALMIKICSCVKFNPGRSNSGPFWRVHRRWVATMALMAPKSATFSFKVNCPSTWIEYFTSNWFAASNFPLYFHQIIRSYIQIKDLLVNKICLVWGSLIECYAIIS